MGVLTNCWYYLALKAERAFALQLGKDKDADEISRMMRSIERCFDTKFWTGSAYRSPGYKGRRTIAPKPWRLFPGWPRKISIRR